MKKSTAAAERARALADLLEMAQQAHDEIGTVLRMTSRAGDALVLLYVDRKTAFDVQFHSAGWTREMKCLFYCFVYAAVKAGIEMPAPAPRHNTPGSLPSDLPTKLTPDEEEHVLELCASLGMNAERWRECGHEYVMAGVATMLMMEMSNTQRPYETYQRLAEELFPTITSAALYAKWRQCRFFSESFSARLNDRMRKRY